MLDPIGAEWRARLHELARSSIYPMSVGAKVPLLVLGLTYLRERYSLCPYAASLESIEGLRQLAVAVETRFRISNELISYHLCAQLLVADDSHLHRSARFAQEVNFDPDFPRWFSDEIDELDFKGHYNTPSSLADTLVGMVCNEFTRTVLDPACGTGGFLASAAAKREAVRVVGQDMSSEACGWAQLRCAVLGQENVKIEIGGPSIDLLVSSEKVDAILCNPPFGFPFGRNKAFGRLSSETAYVQFIADQLSSTGRGAVIVPIGLLFRSGHDLRLREELVDRDILQAVLGLPKRLFAPMTAIETAVLILNSWKAPHLKGNITFVDASKLGRREGTRVSLDEESINEISMAVQDAHESSKIAKIVPIEALADDLSLLPSRYLDVVESLDAADPVERRSEIAEADARYNVVRSQYDRLRARLVKR